MAQSVSIIRLERISAASSCLQTAQLNGGARRRSPRRPGFGSLHSLSVKQEHPRDVQANIDDNGEVESVRERRGGGVHPFERAPVGSRDNTVRFAGGKHAGLWGNNCAKSETEEGMSARCTIKALR